MVWAVSLSPVIAETLAESQVLPHEICGGQSGAGTGSVFHVSVIPPILDPYMTLIRRARG
jgi:hypothetical protein